MLKENRAVILNGRVTPQFNNFTFVSPNRGCSVPDYQFCPLDHLKYCTEMKTLLISEIVNDCGLYPPVNLPDHSVLLSTFNISSYNTLKNTKKLNANPTQLDENPTRPPKKNLKKIKDTFFLSNEIIIQVQNTIAKLENCAKNQVSIDNLWSDIKSMLLNELDTLPDLPTSNQSASNKMFFCALSSFYSVSYKNNRTCTLV